MLVFVCVGDNRLSFADTFEKFLQNKYNTVKRFGLNGKLSERTQRRAEQGSREDKSTRKKSKNRAKRGAEQYAEQSKADRIDLQNGAKRIRRQHATWFHRWRLQKIAI